MTQPRLSPDDLRVLQHEKLEQAKQLPRQNHASIAEVLDSLLSAIPVQEVATTLRIYRKVGKQGIQIAGCWYIHPALSWQVGQCVTVQVSLGDTLEDTSVDWLANSGPIRLTRAEAYDVKELLQRHACSFGPQAVQEYPEAFIKRRPALRQTAYDNGYSHKQWHEAYLALMDEFGLR